MVVYGVFQSTPPVKAATTFYTLREVFGIISIHAAREGGDEYIPQRFPVLSISIHAAREGGDTFSSARASSVFAFQSTPPVKAATL